MFTPLTFSSLLIISNSLCIFSIILFTFSSHSSNLSIISCTFFCVSSIALLVLVNRSKGSDKFSYNVLVSLELKFSITSIACCNSFISSAHFVSSPIIVSLSLFVFTSILFSLIITSLLLFIWLIFVFDYQIICYIV